MKDEEICGSLANVANDKANATLTKVCPVMSSSIKEIIPEVERSPSFLHVRPFFIQFFLCRLPDHLPAGLTVKHFF